MICQAGLGLITSHYGGKTFEYSTQCLMNCFIFCFFCFVFCFSLWLVERGRVPGLVRSLDTVPSNSSWWFLPSSQVVASQACTAQYSAEYSRENLYRTLEFSFCPGLFSPVLCPENSSFLGLTGLSFPSLWVVGYAGSTSVTLPSAIAWKFSQRIKLRYHRACLIYFLSTWDHCSSLPEIQFFENGCFVCFVWVFWLFHAGGWILFLLLHLIQSRNPLLGIWKAWMVPWPLPNFCVPLSPCSLPFPWLPLWCFSPLHGGSPDQCLCQLSSTFSLITLIPPPPGHISV